MAKTTFKELHIKAKKTGEKLDKINERIVKTTEATFSVRDYEKETIVSADREPLNVFVNKLEYRIERLERNQEYIMKQIENLLHLITKVYLSKGDNNENNNE